MNLDTVGAEVDARIGNALDVNARLMKLCRSKANKMFGIADDLERLADEYRRIGSLHVLAAKEHAFILADTLDAEYDIEEEDAEDEDGEPEEDEEEYPGSSG